MKRPLLLLALVASLVACKKDDDPAARPATPANADLLGTWRFKMARTIRTYPNGRVVRDSSQANGVTLVFTSERLTINRPVNPQAGPYSRAGDVLTFQADGSPAPWVSQLAQAGPTTFSWYTEITETSGAVARWQEFYVR